MFSNCESDSSCINSSAINNCCSSEYATIGGQVLKVPSTQLVNKLITSRLANTQLLVFNLDGVIEALLLGGGLSPPKRYPNEQHNK